MSPQTETAQPAAYLLRVERGVPTIVARGTEPALIARHAELDDQRVADGVSMAELYYAVRELDSHDGLVRRALDELDAQLTPRRREALQQLDHATRVPYPRTWVRPGREPSWRGMYSTDLVPFARKLAELGLVQIAGVAYGPKSYRVTALGRELARHLRERAEVV